jgi:hypothetical protein
VSVLQDGNGNTTRSLQYKGGGDLFQDVRGGATYVYRARFDPCRYECGACRFLKLKGFDAANPAQIPQTSRGARMLAMRRAPA